MCHNHKAQPFPDTERKRKQTKPNKRKSNKPTKSTNISSPFPKRGNRNAKRTEKHKNKKKNKKTKKLQIHCTYVSITKLLLLLRNGQEYWSLYIERKFWWLVDGQTNRQKIRSPNPERKHMLRSTEWIAIKHLWQEGNINIGLNKGGFQVNSFLISRGKNMMLLLVLTKSILPRHF